MEPFVCEEPDACITVRSTVPVDDRNRFRNQVPIPREIPVDQVVIGMSVVKRVEHIAPDIALRTRAY